MKYYSEITKNMYDTTEELEEAERIASEKVNARKKDAEAVEAAYKAMIDARKNYEEVLTDFCKKHGAYHKSITSPETSDIFDNLFDIFGWSKYK